MHLAAGEIHVWCANPLELQQTDALQAALTMTTQEEVDRSHQYKFEDDRLRFLATRMLIRAVLSQYVPQPPKAWRFALSEHGRPVIAGHNPLDLRFNLSKTAGLVVCGLVRQKAIGIDVEHLKRTAPLEVADRYFAPAEIAELQCLSSAERARRFYDYWTLKESYVKARGLGLAIPLDTFAIVFEQGSPPRLEQRREFCDDARTWQFTQLQPTEEHLISVCVESSESIDRRVTLHWQSLDGLAAT